MDYSERAHREAREYLRVDTSIVLELAKSGDQDFADSKYAHNYKILSCMCGEIACYLAYNSGKTGWVTDDKRILKINGGKVAYLLFKYSSKVDKDYMLSLCNPVLRFELTLTKEQLLANDGALALKLAEDSGLRFAGDKYRQDYNCGLVFTQGKFAQDYDIVSQRDGEVAVELAKNSANNGWMTNKKSILIINDCEVAYHLANVSFVTFWYTLDSEILQAKNSRVACVLVQNLDRLAKRLDLHEISVILSFCHYGFIKQIINHHSGRLSDKVKELLIDEFHKKKLLDGSKETI